MSQDLDAKAGRIRRLQDLPPLPQVAQSLLQELASGDGPLERLAGLISTEPALTARLIGVANSAYFGGRREVHSVQGAISRLGLNMVRGLALGLLINDHFSPARCRALDLDRYWFVSMAGARLARELARHVRAETVSPDQAYLAALLRQLGLIVLCDLEPEAMGRVLQRAGQADAAGLARRTRRELGLDHQDAGGILARRWHLPADVPVVMGGYADPAYHGEHTAMVQIIGLCDMLAETLYDETPASPSSALLMGLELDVEPLWRAVESCQTQREAMVSVCQTLTQSP
ncbi:HD-like signal output (HDOD) domain, no enzymatic activity [Ectothiorhodospira mobilis]|uniref:HD-like signal output (HDOD) domain, no enzymatic activity n=1 Tax=Ectothiorhodospira mobilis TaxID=195064 RepID=A0A1I4R408_ECTMO|nr:HDOD domain-containing protein [Ectothiorhodospira mobilis]SFM46865.1 HD-like signal output (HDOD) domain, no enzymatic activity [Ectothiorhodospira mobilis]